MASDLFGHLKDSAKLDPYRKRISTLEGRVDSHREALKQVNSLLKEMIARIETLERQPKEDL